MRVAPPFTFAATPARSPAWHWLAVALLALGQFALHAQAVLIVDSGRDLANAWWIARGAHWPLLGPSINGADLLGPAWFYLLALPYAITGSTTAVIAVVAALAAMTYPLAYLAGRRWRDPATGLAFAAALALPGWLGFEAVVFSHTSLTSFWIVLSGWLALRARERPSSGRLAALGMALAMALHAHPTALAVVALITGWTLLRAERSARGIGGDAAVLMLAGSLPWWPWAWAMATREAPSASASAALPSAGELVAGALDVLGGALSGIEYAARFLLPDAAWAQAGLLLALALAAAALLIAIARLLRDERALLAAVASTIVVHALLLAAALSTTRAWMLFALLPLPALLLGRSLVLATEDARRRWLLPLFAALAVLLTLAQVARRASETIDGEIAMPGARVADVRTDDWTFQTNLWLPGIALERAVSTLCAPPGEVALHGDLAYLARIAEFVPLASACGSGAPTLGGTSTRPMAGYPLAALERIGLTPMRRVAGFGLLPPTQVVRSIALDPRPDSRYLPTRLASAAPRSLALGFTCPRHGVLAVGNRMALLVEPLALAVRDSTGSERVALSPTTASRFFACAAGERLDITIATADPAALDILYFATGEPEP